MQVIDNSHNEAVAANDFFGDHIIVLDEIHHGPASHTYLVYDQNIERTMVSKVFHQQPENHFNQEKAVYNELSQHLPQSPSFPRCYYIHENDESAQYIMLSHEDVSVGERCLVPDCPQLSMSQILRFGINGVGSIQQLHSRGYLHRDVKPDNFLYHFRDLNDPTDSGDRTCLVNFGHASLYGMSHSDGGFSHTVTVRFGRAAESGGKSLTFGAPHSYNPRYTLGRKDDLISLVYCMIHLLHQQLPWSNIVHSIHLSYKERGTQIQRMKKAISTEQLCAGFPHQFHAAYERIINTAYSQHPDYEAIINDFMEASQP